MTVSELFEDEPIIKLGEMLYFEKTISLKGDVSCNHCHKLDKYGVDGLERSTGHVGFNGHRNTPSIYNSHLQLAKFWDGRVRSDEVTPIANSMGLKTSFPEIEKNDEYMNLFRASFASSSRDKNIVNPMTIAKAINEFSKTLITQSRFDKYLEGDHSQLNEQEKRGLNKFVSAGCVSCHNAELLGGSSFQVLGIVEPCEADDLGRYYVTREDNDKRAFKVPSLRNVTKTAPYFHDGSIRLWRTRLKLWPNISLMNQLIQNLLMM